MASSIDRSEDALPRPELNPLVNPLLADNMGRWAEVYFTNPPEKREEAVLELLRELEAQKSSRERSSASSPSLRPATGMPVPAIPRTTTETRDDRKHLRRCQSCGHDNPPGHQFCGMCGGQQLSGIPSERLGADKIEAPRGTGSEPALAFNPEADAEFREPIEEPLATVGEFGGDPYDLSLLQGLREKEVAYDGEFESSPSTRYRYYIAGILAILIFILGYLAWNRSRANQNAGAPPLPPPATATDTTPASADSNGTPSVPPRPAETHPAPAAAKGPIEPTTHKPTEAPKQVARADLRRHTPVATPPARPQPTANDAALRNSSGSGAEEFAMAQRHLTSQPRNASEAASLLWKAIRKHNGPAVLALADLYLKGDGVPKSCDQARVLLDSAARQGMAGAGERLRNLQAFGCQ